MPENESVKLSSRSVLWGRMGSALATLLLGFAWHSPALAVDPKDLGEGDLAQLFEVFDSNENGVVTREELAAVVASLSLDLGDTDFDRLIDRHDLNGDKALQRLEFDRLMRGIGDDGASLDAEMERVFLRFDANQDGGLDAREVRALMEASGETLSLRDAKRIVFEADTDGDGRIDAREFQGVKEDGGKPAR